MILLGMLLLAVSLGGFLPQFRSARAIRSQLLASEAESAKLRQRLAGAEVRDLAALIQFEVTRRSYGTAGQHSAALFDRLQQRAAGGAAGAPFREALAARDRITAGLASADPAVLTEVQRIFLLVSEATRGQ